MASATVLQQQRVQSVPIGADPWQYWTPAMIASVTGASLSSVMRVHPLIVERLAYFGINDKRVQATTIATIAIETASTYLPVREAFWLDDRYGYEWAEQWRHDNLWYYDGPLGRGYYGRGLIQLTHKSNYRAEGDAIGIDLVSNPDLALRPDVAADAFGRFFLTHGVADAARMWDLPEVRRRVQGGYASLDRLISISNRLMAS